MELDDLKKTWTQYDKKLNDKLKLNEQLIRKLNLNNSKREMQKILYYELFGIITLLAAILLVMYSSFYYLNQIKYSLPGFIGAAFLGLVLAFAIIRTKSLLDIDYYGSSVVKVQKSILKLKHQTLRFRKFELLLIPVYVLPILPVLFKYIHNIDIYSNIWLLIVEVVLITGISYPLMIWLYKYLYDKKFKNAENLLEELEQFEQQ